MEQFLNFLLDDEKSAVKGKKMTFNKGENLKLESTDGQTNYVFGISEGIIAVNQDMSILEFLGPNQFLGLTTDKRSKLYGEVLSKAATVWKFNLQDVLMAVSNSKNGLQLYNEYMVGAYDRLTKKISIMKLNKQNRLHLSLRMIGSSFAEKTADGSVVRLPECFTKKALASYTGIKASTLTNILKKLHEGGQIIYSRRVLLINL
ncbi:Crp/Fnr family transcriptional regulator [Listeria booriae]|uniref:Crp/Fnr family transcriptional regulator n=1 Tax=Listeria booriae TaxID=1552123 RepID=A0A7X0XZA3_9LIST|nr:Crp/Fnr family transcriptional regulator [Listeria booriae]MBC1247839.1 Crp/Fnr family transcriptional regulator [Listeria booriae]MBC1794106.1 Crp/Fnr family transcriptional regulator [Listeria booriae]MBC1800017.1 Crp/Fnr family transcriptional regulator [Listeria booriae]MBC1804425.1 Crp/Fnr family transcriptional regulator [Listeria booriae]MBC1814030.1 Crp/Fnr family transcriptional regulator [Listeria booriae]